MTTLKKAARMSDNLVTLHVADYAVYVAWILACEAIQCYYTQPYRSLALDSIFLALLYVTLVSFHCPFLAHFCIITFTVFETICWAMTHRGICSQVIWAIADLPYVWLVRPEFFLYVLAILVADVLVSRLQLRFFQVIFPVHRLIVALLFACVSFPFAGSIYDTLVPYRVQYGVTPSSDRIVHYLATPRISVTNVTQRKNLILWHIECAEQQSLGLFNHAHREFMPHLSRLANSTTVLERHIMNRADWFTMASVFTQQSGLPLLGLSAWDKGSVFSSKLAHLIADYLSEAGYYCVASCTRYCAQIVLYHRHKTQVIDAMKHGAERDWPHWKYIQEQLLPDLASQRQPFYLILHSEDTHPFFFVDPKCLEQRPELQSWPKALAAFECTDLLIPKFMERVKELGLENNTEVVLYGDHLLWGEPQFYDHGEERRLLMVFASQNQSRIVKRTTWFDVAPTLLDLVGIKGYDPHFPYGENMFSDRQGTEPSDNDRVYIQNMVLAKG
jgi:hypothetical protein